jgi:hypothetical protein
MNRILGIAAALGLGAALVPAAGTKSHPLLKDKTGVRWVLPFKQAQATAKEQKRLLFIKPVAFGTTPDGGW